MTAETDMADNKELATELEAKGYGWIGKAE